MHEILADKVMKMLLSGEDNILEILRSQYTDAVIINIENSPVGFFVKYDASNYVIDNNKYVSDFQIGDLYGSVDGIQFALGFLVYIKNGFITMLEGYTNGIDKWPDNDDKISLTFDSGSKRNYDVLRNRWNRK